MSALYFRLVFFIGVICPIMLLTSCADSPTETTLPNSKGVQFNWFEYVGDDDVFRVALKEGQFQNPIVSGFFPDPSITRKGDDYYMAHSSFSYAPGVPILHSTDLVNWKLIGHALTRKSQIDFSGLNMSEGIFAPTLRYHDGLFYLITTAVNSGGNFYVTAENPEGPWSDPVFLPEIGGIDPDLFFDDDGKVYIAHNFEPEGESLYQGHRAIWLWEFDLNTKKVVPDSGRMIINGGVNLKEEPIWIEGPHLYKINGWYYLMCAEGGTSIDHREVIFRTRDLNEPFIPYENNPILTQKFLPNDRRHPITSVGHADLIETPSGEWWTVFLGTRPYAENYYNTGRETFLLPVTWKNQWPSVLPVNETVAYRLQKPESRFTTETTEPLTGNFRWRDEFSEDDLSLQWNTLRLVTVDWATLNEDAITLEAKTEKLSGKGQPAYIGRRQQHSRFVVESELLVPEKVGISGGLAAFQSSGYHYYFALYQRDKNQYELFLEKTENNQSVVVERHDLEVESGETITLGIRGDGGIIGFYFRQVNDKKQNFLTDQDAKILSTEVAGGFIGATLGLHARIEK